MNVSEIVTAFGAHYLKSGQNINSLYRQLMRGFVTQNVFTPVVTEETIWRAAETKTSSIVQPFQVPFTPKGVTTFTPVEIRQYRLKADLPGIPDTLVETWLGFLANIDQVERKNWPFIRWWIENEIVPKIQEDIELNEIGRGVYAPPTPGVAGPSGTSMNGILTVINTHIAAGRISPTSLGGLPASDLDVVSYFENFHKELPKEYWRNKMMVYGPEDIVLRYKRGYGEKYGLRSNFTESPDGTIDVKFTNLTVAGLPSLNLKADGTPNDRIFATPKSNAIMLMKGMQNSKGIFGHPGTRPLGEIARRLDDGRRLHYSRAGVRQRRRGLINQSFNPGGEAGPPRFSRY